MLRNVLDGYLASASERELDLPLLLLLPAMGFHDVHLTHGAVEFGKDFIAKKHEDGAEVQYVIQSKAGDIDQAEWRSIQGQILEAVTNTLSHPSFDAALPLQAVLATSGALRGNARLAIQNLNEGLLRELGRRPVVVWDGQDLVDHFARYGLSGVHRATAEGFVDHGRFFLAYARALQGTLSDRDIEAYSRQWPDAAVPLERRLLRAAVEAEILSQRCADHGHYWEAITAHLALLRVLCAAAYTDAEADLAGPYAAGVARLHDLCSGYLAEIRAGWSEERNLLRTPFGPLDVTTYPVHCARIAEVTSLAYFSTSDEGRRADCAAFLADFVRAEPGCGHPLGDRFASSLVLASLALVDADRHDVARGLVERATVWLCDRYQYGMGLAGIEADEAEETRTLLGYPFDFVDLPERRGSFLAAALGDLAAFVGDRDLYRAVVNDVKTCGIFPRYYQPHDTVGACSVEARDVVRYPSVSYEDDLTEYGEYRFANHLADESQAFRFAAGLGPSAAVVLAALLRDRYFPKLWPRLAPGRTRTA